MRLQFYSLIFTLVALNSCADQSEFKGSDGVRKATKIPDAGIQTESPVQLTASCEIEASRVSAGAGKCNVSVTTTGDLGSAKPQLSPSAQESAWVVNENVFSSTVPCPVGGGKITATISAAGEGQPAFKELTCDVDVPAVANPQCEIQVDKNTVTLGAAISAKVHSADGPVDETKLNDVKINLDQNVHFTPPSSGSFVLNATVRRGTTYGSCTKSVTVNAVPANETVKVTVTAVPEPIVDELSTSASCSLTATRLKAAPGKCSVKVSSTGGAISGLPVIAGSSALVQSGTQWTGVVPCALAGGEIKATVNGATTGSAECAATVAAPIWVQTNGGECNAVCSGVKRISGRSPKYKNVCVSGEDRGDAVGIRYVNGTWGGGVEFYQTTSVGNRCYGSNPSKGQKRDNDATDITVGCYCL